MWWQSLPCLPFQVLSSVGLSWHSITMAKLLHAEAEILLVCTSEPSFYGFSLQLYSIFTYFSVVKLWLFLLTSFFESASSCCINNPSVLQSRRTRNKPGWVSPCNDLGTANTVLLQQLLKNTVLAPIRLRVLSHTRIVTSQVLSWVLWICWSCQPCYSCIAEKFLYSSLVENILFFKLKRF